MLDNTRWLVVGADETEYGEDSMESRMLDEDAIEVSLLPFD